MTSKSEDVLLQVSQVRYKKGDGTLYLMSERLAWMLDHKDTVCLSHRYADIKLQKISPEGKPKIQLQVVLHDNTTSTFQFVNRQGTEAAIKERDKVKDLLVTILPKFKRKVNKELEEKNRLLSENPSLLQLYRDLVITDVVTSEEFWATHAAAYLNKSDKKQQVGVSGAFLADIKPQTDGCNGLKYNLTPDVMEAVFRTYPAVRQKHREAVPNKMTEAQFWTKFFQSHYFHRDRINAGTKDLFMDCARIDDQVLTKEMNEGVDDPLVDVASFEDTNLGEGYGSSLENAKGSSQNIVHQFMIKRFNQHSIMVLKACQGSGMSEATPRSQSHEPPPSSPASKPHVNGTSSATEEHNHRNAKKRRLHEKITYEDLEQKELSTSPVKLNLTKVERYLQGPVTTDEPAVQPVTEADLPLLAQALVRLKEEAGHYPLHCPNHSLVAPSVAVGVLGELTPGGALMRAHHDDSLAQLVSDSWLKEVRGIYTSTCELLRHFWACFPPTTPELQAKAEHSYNALRKLQTVKIKPFENKVMLDYSPLSQQMTLHLNQLLNTAYKKYEVWQSRRKQQVHIPNLR